MASGDLMRLIKSARIWIWLLAFTAITCTGSMYSTFNFAWVCMVNSSRFDEDQNETLNVGADYGGTLPWDRSIQQVLFSTYSIGSILSIPAGWFVNRFGAKLTISISVTLCSISSILIPVTAVHTYIGVGFLRVLVGIGNGFSWPIIYYVCAHWSPKAETGVAVALVSSGFQAGQFFNLMLAGLECSTIKWQWVFYLPAIAGIAFVIVWLVVFKDEPTDLKCINDAEKQHILNTRNLKKESNEKRKVPWCSILTSLPVWSCMVGRFCVIYMAFVVNQFTPTYLKEILSVPVEGNGYLSSLPLLGQMVGRWVSGPLSDVPLGPIKGHTWRMRFFTVFALVGGAACSLGLAVIGSDTPVSVAVVLLTGLMFISAFVTGGFIKAPLHIAPQYGSIIGSLMNVASSIASLIVPYVVAGITYKQSIAEWHAVFYIVAGVGVFGALFFLVFGQGTLQSWAVQTEPTAVELQSVSSGAHSGRKS